MSSQNRLHNPHSPPVPQWTEMADHALPPGRNLADLDVGGFFATWAHRWFACGVMRSVPKLRQTSFGHDNRATAEAAS